jgi:2-dehydro-3-deoxyphosphogluconate aldolase/(4S)-4-hydroxy-2-oxoglutarate aldolase
MKDKVTHRIENLGVFPIAVLERADDAPRLAEALHEGGLPCLEVTFRTAAAEQAIRIVAREFPEMLLGAGTVLQVDQAAAAIEAGARFILAPGFNPKVVDYCLCREVTVFPGVCTPTEIEAAMSKGLHILKFFPSEAMGGLRYLKAISAPLSMVSFIPTGGVNLQNLPDYLAFDKVLACAGTWIVKKEWLAKGEFDRIREEAKNAVRIVSSVRGGNDG